MGLRAVSLTHAQFVDVLAGRATLQFPDAVPADVALHKVETFGTDVRMLFASATWLTHSGCCAPNWNVVVVAAEAAASHDGRGDGKPDIAY